MTRPLPSLALILSLTAAGTLGCSGGLEPETRAPPRVRVSEPTPIPKPPPRLVSEVPAAARQLAKLRGMSPSVDCPVDALAGLRDLHARFPEDFAVDEPLLIALKACRDWEGMAALLEQRLDGSGGSGPLPLAKIHIRAKSFDRAIELLLPLSDARPDDPKVTWPLALALFDAGRRLEASPHLDAVAAGRAAQGHADVLVLQGLIAIDRGDLEAALAILQRATEVDPGHVASWNTLGRTKARLGDQAGASAAFDEADRLNLLQTQLEAKALRLGGLVASLRRAYATRRHGAAQALIDELLPLATPVLTASLYEMRAAILRAQGDAAGAETAMKQAAEWKQTAGSAP